MSRCTARSTAHPATTTPTTPRIHTVTRTGATTGSTPARDITSTTAAADTTTTAMTDTIATADAITDCPIAGIATITGLRSVAIAMTIAPEIGATNDLPAAAIATTTRTYKNEGTVV